MTEMTMRERVARAICSADSPVLNAMQDDYWVSWLPEADAAIAAMREPTETMADAGGAAFLDAAMAHESGDKTNRPFVRYFRAMIDAALAEPSP